MELIRDLLLKIEANQQMDRTREYPLGREEISILGHSDEEIHYHLDLLFDAQYIAGNPKIPTVSGLTMAGHDFLDSIKDPSIWKMTKQRLADLPGVTLKIFAAVAEAEIIKHLGLK